MSGRQAKAKRKSAKKAAATPAPASARPRADFIIENVRCFAGEQRVPIRPITLLVGENSTGKTTFLGCFHTAINLAVPSHKNMTGNGVNFNTPPFSMGGFRDIARRQPGKESAVDEFRAGFAVPAPNAGGPESLIFSYGERDMEAVVAKVRFDFGDGEMLEIAREEPEVGIITGPDFRVQVPLPDNVQLTPIPVMTMALLSLGPDAKGEEESEKRQARRFLEKRLDFRSADFWSGKFASGFLEGARMMSEQFAMAFAPMRSKPKRTYSVLDDDPESEGGDVPKFLFRLSKNKPKQWRELRKRLVDFGKESGMFSDFNAVTHGAQAGGDFHLEVKTRGMRSNMADVGYGVSQVYPLLVPAMRASQRKIPMVFLLQEPEIHLHPQAQAALASFFAKSANDPGRGFIIETHGDGIIDRVRVCVKRGDIAPEDVVLLYFEPDKKTGAVKIHPIHVDKLGNVLGAPVGYRRFFLDETDRLLGFKK